MAAERLVGTTTRTLHGAEVTLPDDALDQLRLQLGGSVSSGGRADAPETFNAMHQGRPGLSVICRTTADVVAAVNFARERDLLVAVRGGGHSIAGFSAVEGSMLIDLGSMRGVHVDPETRLARVQGGARWADLDREAQAFGLATPGGVVSDTGVAGLALGGGYGWLRRAFGLSCDNVIAAQVVCADGTVRSASADANPDLFWAIRGGGGNFGIVTSLTFRLHRLGPLVPFAGVFYPLSEARDILARWRAYVASAPREVTSNAVAFTFPSPAHMPEVLHRAPVLVIGGLHAGDVDTGMTVLQPLRELGTPLFDVSGPMPFVAVQSSFDPMYPRNTYQSYWKSLYLDSLGDDAIELLATTAAARPSPFTMLSVLHLGGAIAEIPPEATAFAERSASFLVSIDGNWENAADNAANIAWVRRTRAALAKLGNGSVYLNFDGRADELPAAGVDTAFGRNLARLTRIKTAMDPKNLFRLNNNISPSP